MKTALPALVASVLLAGNALALTPAQKFTKPWQLAPDAVVGVIGTHDVPDCDKIYAKPSADTAASDPDNGDFLVYCTMDNKKFVAWEVLPNEDSATGPMPLPKGIPLPDPRTIR